MTGHDVAVVLGGPSAEHDVSLVSGRAIAAALAERGHRVDGWLIDLAGGWWRLSTDAMDPSLPPTEYDDPDSMGARGPFTAGVAVTEIASDERRPVAWIALHGPFGEDGTIQALCEAHGVVYTGSGVTASALGMDKSLFKRFVSGLGMPVVPWVAVGATEYASDPRSVVARLREFAAGLPDGQLIVKPARLGSSVGISVVHRLEGTTELETALTEALTYDTDAVVEAYLSAPRELEASVVGNDADGLEVYGPGEIFPGHEFYDYTAKYQAGVSRTTRTPELEPRVREQLRATAARAYLAIGAEGFARVDFLLAGQDLFISEINTIPGFTPISLFPLLCREGGYDFGAIAEHILGLAVERGRTRTVRRLTRADLP